VPVAGEQDELARLVPDLVEVARALRRAGPERLADRAAVLHPKQREQVLREPHAEAPLGVVHPRLSERPPAAAGHEQAGDPRFEVPPDRSFPLTRAEG
jgi:hypothetical protein